MQQDTPISLHIRNNNSLKTALRMTKNRGHTYILFYNPSMGRTGLVMSHDTCEKSSRKEEVIFIHLWCPYIANQKSCLFYKIHWCSGKVVPW